MFSQVKRPSQIDVALSDAFLALKHEAIDSKEYETMLARVQTLYEVKNQDKPRRVDPNTWAIIGANLLGIILIIKHENVNVITSRAFGLLMRP